MEATIEVKRFATPEERREYLNKLDPEKYTPFCLGKLSPASAPDGRCYKVNIIRR
jgi:hypothetical protein